MEERLVKIASFKTIRILHMNVSKFIRKTEKKNERFYQKLHNLWYR